MPFIEAVERVYGIDSDPDYRECVVAISELRSKLDNGKGTRRDGRRLRDLQDEVLIYEWRKRNDREVALLRGGTPYEEIYDADNQGAAGRGSADAGGRDHVRPGHGKARSVVAHLRTPEEQRPAQGQRSPGVVART